MILRLFIFAFSFMMTSMASFYVRAQSNETVEENSVEQVPAGQPTTTEEESVTSSPVVEPQEGKPLESPREGFKYLATASYSALDLPIPNKWGVTVGIITEPEKTWELEYLKGSLSVPGGFRDLGSLNDTRIGLVGRSFVGNSIHLRYGVSFFDFSANIGDELIKNMTNGVYPAMNAMHIQGLGFNAGLGNIWVFKKKIMVGVDWLSWSQPLVVLKRSSDFIKNSDSVSTNEYVEDTMRIVSYLPRLALLHVHVGMMF